MATLIAITFLALYLTQLIIGKKNLKRNPNPLMRQSKWMKLIS